MLVAGFKMYGSPNYGDGCSQVEAGKVTVSTRHQESRGTLNIYGRSHTDSSGRRAPAAPSSNCVDWKRPWTR